MKKMLFVFLVSMLTLTGCGANEKTPEQAPEAKSEEKTEETEKKEVVMYLTRHGKTMLNTSDRVQGWADSPLTEPGVEVAEQLGRGLNLEGIKFDGAYSSDSGRAIETAKIVLEQCGQLDTLPLVQMKDLREWNFGIFEGDYNDNMLEAVAKTINYEGEEDVRVMLGLDELADAIAQSDETNEAENWETASGRIMSAFDKIGAESEENGGGNILVVAHGMTINTLLKVLDPEYATKPVPNAAVAKIIYVDGQFTVETVNDESYIEKGAK